MNTLKGDPTPSEALSSEIEVALRSLASKLQALTPDRRPGGADAICGDNVLLDVVLGDVRLLALRLRRPSPMSLLSPREQEIARMVAKGYANKTIASVLEISSWTVASHLRRIFMKLQVSSRAAMATSLSGAGGNELPSLLNDVLTDDGAADTRRSEDEASLHSVPPDDLSLTARLMTRGGRLGLEIYGHGVAGEILDIGGVLVERGPGIRQSGRDPGAPGPRRDGS